MRACFNSQRSNNNERLHDHRHVTNDLHSILPVVLGTENRLIVRQATRLLLHHGLIRKVNEQDVLRHPRKPCVTENRDAGRNPKRG